MESIFDKIMENEILFTERQRFTQWWVWVILLGVNSVFVYIIIRQVVFGHTIGNQPMSNLMLLFVFGLTLLPIFFFIFLRLDTHIKEDGIYVRFFPFHLSFREYKFTDLTKVFVRTYSPIPEYGGWGYRIGLFGKGSALNVSGNIGLQLEFSNKKKILIGTQKSDELTNTLIKLGQLRQ